MRRKNKQGRNKQINTNKKNPINSPAKEPTGNIPESTNNDNNDKKDKNFNRSLLWINIAMLLAFIVVNYFLIQNANKSVEVAEKDNKIALRAYINAVDFKLKQFEVGKEVELTIGARNIGNTPAFEFKSYINVKIGGTGIYPTDWKNIPDTGKNIIVIGTNVLQPIPIFSTYILKSINDSINIINGRIPFWILGNFKYKDIFGEDHNTKFSVIWNPKWKEFFNTGLFSEQN